MASRALAASFLTRHGLSPPVSYPELVVACEADGLRVVLSARWLQGRGYFVGGPLPTAILRTDADARVLAHEIAHFLMSDPDAEYHVAAFSHEEPLVDAFVEVVCGSSPSG